MGAMLISHIHALNPQMVFNFTFFLLATNGCVGISLLRIVFEFCIK
jgi:hypothetical protein